LRNWLLRLPGVGPKTASWVVRNHLGSDRVAIIDVHLLRAGVIAGVYDPAWTPAKHYDLLEDFFLAWADHGRVSAAALDSIIWADMAGLGRSVYDALGVPDDRPSWYAVEG
jgi:thermostable 8-oxoguanine DNA glycosylase